MHEIYRRRQEKEKKPLRVAGGHCQQKTALNRPKSTEGCQYYILWSKNYPPIKLLPSVSGQGVDVSGSRDGSPLEHYSLVWQLLQSTVVEVQVTA